MSLGFACVKTQDGYYIAAARDIMRTQHEVYSSEKAEAKFQVEPERLVTYIKKLKKLNADEVNRTLRSAISKYGESYFKMLWM